MAYANVKNTVDWEISSRASEESEEGSTTRAWSPNWTVKPHEYATREGRYSLNYGETHRSVDKEPHDNKLNSVPYSGKLDALSQWDVKRPVMQALKNDAVKTFDRAVQTQFNNTRLRIAPQAGTSTTSLTLFTTGTCTSTNSAAYNSTYHKLLIDAMKERNIPPYLGDDYVAVAWPSTWRTLKNNMETLHAYTPPGLGLIMNGEIGRYETTRFVEQTNILKGVANDGTAWTNGLSDWAYFFGEDTVMEGVVVPEEIRAKIPTDYGRSKGVAYYALMGWGIVQTNATDDRILKWDSKA